MGVGVLCIVMVVVSAGLNVGGFVSGVGNGLV